MNSLARQYNPFYRTREDALSAGIPDDDIIHTADDFFCSEDDAVSCSGCGTFYSDRSELDEDLLCPTCADEPDWQADESISWGQQRGCGSAPFGGW